MENDNMVESSSKRKEALFLSILPVIKERLGRDIDNIEAEAIAFVINQSPDETLPVSAQEYLSARLGIGEGDVGRDAAMRIHNSIYKAQKDKINELIEKNPSDGERWMLVRENIEIGHNAVLENYRKPNAKVYIGAVLSEWVPAWSRATNPPLGQER